MSGRKGPPRAKRDTLLMATIFADFVSVTGSLIRELQEAGLDDHLVAEALNRRGFPCWGRTRWTARSVRLVLRHEASPPKRE